MIIYKSCIIVKSELLQKFSIWICLQLRLGYCSQLNDCRYILALKRIICFQGLYATILSTCTYICRKGILRTLPLSCGKVSFLLILNSALFTEDNIRKSPLQSFELNCRIFYFYFLSSNLFFFHFHAFNVMVDWLNIGFTCDYFQTKLLTSTAKNTISHS